MKIYCICINEVVMVSSHQNQLKNCQIGQCSKKKITDYNCEQRRTVLRYISCFNISIYNTVNFNIYFLTIYSNLVT